jgi:pimeloyl-ACP methyl ester carboxylesterase
MAKSTRMGFTAGLIVVLAMMVMPITAFSQQTQGLVSKNTRLELKPDKILCRSKEYQGMRGTLYVPEDRTKPDSRTIELPVVVVKSLSSDPDYPIFRFAGGPGVSNMNLGDNINESDLANHDLVEVGYRGVDGSPQLKHPLFNEILRTPDFLSQTCLKEIGRKFAEACASLTETGIDVRQYNILNVVDDMEVARAALGYNKINITGGSYGGAVVMVYCLRYPQSIHRAIMAEAAFPYDIAFGKPAEFDARLNHINELWKKNAEAVKRSPDIVQTMRNVLAKLPKEYNGMPIDQSKVKLMTSFGITNWRSYANMVFDAYISAEKGDFSSIAAMCLMYEMFIGLIQYPGDLLAKTYSSVTEPDRDFVSELDDPDSVIGSPLSMLAWGCFQYSHWPVISLVKEHPPTQKSTVETLIFYGSKETGESFRNKYRNNFINAHWVILDNLGHGDIWTITAGGTQHLMRTFLNEGVVDTSKFGSIPEWDFTPQATFNQILQQMTQQGREAPKN